MTLGNKPAILICQKEKKDNYKLKLFSEEEIGGCLKDVVEVGQVSLQVLILTTALSYSPCLCATFLWAAVATTAAAVKAQECKAPICPLPLLQMVQKGDPLIPPCYGSAYISSLMCA